MPEATQATGETLTWYRLRYTLKTPGGRLERWSAGARTIRGHGTQYASVDEAIESARIKHRYADTVERVTARQVVSDLSSGGGFGGPSIIAATPVAWLKDGKWHRAIAGINTQR